MVYIAQNILASMSLGLLRNPEGSGFPGSRNLSQRHILGFQIKLAGQAPRAARFHGVSPTALVLLCMGISGALAGLAGLFEVSGPAGQISIDFNVGYGFTAIIVAFLGRLNPVGILLAGL